MSTALTLAIASPHDGSIAPYVPLAREQEQPPRTHDKLHGEILRQGMWPGMPSTIILIIRPMASEWAKNTAR
jgi:hypothetical protein